MPGRMYRLPDLELSQGDIIDDVPHLRLRPPLENIRKITVGGGRLQWAPFPYPPEEGKTPDAARPGKTINLPPFHVKEGEFVTAWSRFTRAMLLNYDCDLAHEENHCLIAMVRPITGIHEDDRPIIRENRNWSYFHMPADEELGIEEGYVDLRQVTCLDPELVTALGKRRASLSPEGVGLLHAQVFRFLTRRELPGP